ncbi:MAG: 4-hydroxythreonine-4-phosphate dehydrogenase PdxA [bacterium]|nr:4-hydroxythreonine-4-phosphate dehydrogenase PdxA [bacterium]
MGDAAGIGPETIVKAWPQIDRAQAQVVVVGDAQWITETARHHAPGLKILAFKDWNQMPTTDAEGIRVYDFAPLDRQDFSLGKPHAGAGDLAYKCIVEGARLAQEGAVAALVTAPICKESLHLAGHHFDGHTGLLAHLTGTTDYRMTFSTRALRILHVTAHMPLAQACREITEERVFRSIQIGQEHLVKLGIDQPRIAVCGLNPHAGEAGIFGREDIDQILPAIRRAQNRGWNVVGPEPGDAVFIAAFKGKYDLVVAQYHDQGHIPGKLVAFDQGVNVTLGLPFVRCSPDHGTAFDIAGKGVAKEGNLIEAIHYALLLLR